MLEGVNLQGTVYGLGESREPSDRFAGATPNSEHADAVTTDRKVRNTPGQDEAGADGRKRDTFELSQEAEQIRTLQARDREVRAHEAAHAAAGGAYAGSPSYTFKRGPDGQSYAVGGEVGIDMSPVSGDPQATMQKAQQIRTAALAPMQPSSQDMRVAQKAQAMEAKARQEISSEMSTEMQNMVAQSSEHGVGPQRSDNDSPAIPAPQGDGSVSGATTSGFARLSVQA